MLHLLHRINNSGKNFTGDLSFVNDWKFFMPDPSKHLESLVPSGPYAGTLDAFATGVKLRTRYEHLRTYALEQNQTRLWASGSNRVAETARYFAAGFYGLDWEDVATLQVIPETADLGADTLTPGDTCRNYYQNVDERGHDYGYRMLEDFRSTYLPAVSSRLRAFSPNNLTFSQAEIYVMQEICCFETIAKGSSPWCDVFTHDEWLAFEYARDLLHYYRAGPGNRYGPTMGWLLLNATKVLLNQGPEQAGPLFFSL